MRRQVTYRRQVANKLTKDVVDQAETKTYTIHVELEGSFAQDVEIESDTLDDAVREAVDITWDRANHTPLQEILTKEDARCMNGTEPFDFIKEDKLCDQT